MKPRQQDDRTELREIFRGNVHAVYAFFAYSVDHATAEDLASATFERVVRSWDRYDPVRASPRTWILAIARNVLTDHYRRQRFRRTVSTDEHPALLERLLGDEEVSSRVVSAAGFAEWLELLSPREQEVLALRFGADLPAGEIARLLDVSEANIHQISSRALRRLRDRMQPAKDSDAPLS